MHVDRQRTVAPGSSAGMPPYASRHSIPSGDVALCSVPPYSTQPWLPMGVVVHSALLARAGMRVRVIRPLDPPFATPPRLLHACLTTFSRDPSIEERLDAMQAAYDEAPRFFESLVDELLAGGESVVGLSVWRNNVDASVQVAKLLKARSPSTFVMLGGPEAIDEPPSLRLPWIDAVVSIDAEGVLVALVEALLARHPERAASLPNVWINPALVGHVDPTPAPMPTSVAALPPIDYAPLLPLLAGDAEATVPLLLNWGCPYYCGFCSNHNIYSRFTPGRPEAVVEQIDTIMRDWVALHGGQPHGITLHLSDATTNALPPQLDAVLEGLIRCRRGWATAPMIRGQTLFDTRITAERVRLMAAAGFRSTFFGLESGSDRLRRALQKPGTVAQVAAAMLVYHRSGVGGLHFGIPVGIPGETDDDFRETERFVQWALELEGTIASVTVLPYAFFPTPQDPELCARNVGERRGILWRTATPGGDPATRARRFMRLFDLIGGRVPVTCPFPPYLFLPDMLPDEDPSVLEAWMERHGRSFDQITPVKQPEGLAAAPVVDLALVDPEFSAAWERARSALSAQPPTGGWRVERFDGAIAGASTRGRTVLFRREAAPECLVLLLEPRGGDGPSYAQTRDFNVSYLKEWNGVEYAFDGALLAWCVDTLRRAEREGA